MSGEDASVSWELGANRARFGEISFLWVAMLVFLFLVAVGVVDRQSFPHIFRPLVPVMLAVGFPYSVLAGTRALFIATSKRPLLTIDAEGCNFRWTVFPIKARAIRLRDVRRVEVRGRDIRLLLTAAGSLRILAQWFDEPDRLRPAFESSWQGVVFNEVR